MIFSVRILIEFFNRIGEIQPVRTKCRAAEPIGTGHSLERRDIGSQ
jgi:hypothetical protein